MKNFMINTTSVLAIIFLVFLGCRKDDDKQNNTKKVEHLTIDKIKELFPEALYNSSSYVVFKNASGEEKKLKIYRDEGIITKRKASGANYTTDYIQYNLREEESPSYYLEAGMQVNFYGENDAIVENLFVSIRNNAGNKFTTIPITLGELGLFNIAGSKILLNKTFSDVYFYDMRVTGQVGYSELFYNKEFGFLGFRDGNDDLFVYERIE